MSESAEELWQHLMVITHTPTPFHPGKNIPGRLPHIAGEGRIVEKYQAQGATPTCACHFSNLFFISWLGR